MLWLDVLVAQGGRRARSISGPVEQWSLYRKQSFLFEVLFYIANQTGIDAQYYDGDRIKSVAR